MEIIFSDIQLIDKKWIIVVGECDQKHLQRRADVVVVGIVGDVVVAVADDEVTAAVWSCSP